MTAIKPRILVVENETFVAIETRHTLESLGYEVVGVATTGEEALRLAAELRPDLALMEFDIGGAQGGIGIAGDLKRDWDVPVVYLGACADDETLRRAQATAPLGFLTKPFEVGELRATLEMALERDGARRRLRQSEERGQAVIDNALDCIVIIDHQSRIVEFNPAAEATFGYSKSEAVGRTLDDVIVPPEFRAAHHKGMAHFLQCGEGPFLNHRVEVPALCKDGTEITVELVITVVTGTQPPLFIAYMRDVTQSKRAKDALAQSEARFQNIIGNVPGMVYQFVIQPDGRVEWPFVGEGCREIFEVEPTLVRDNPSFLLDSVHPDDREGFYDRITESQTTLSPWLWEGRHRLPSGKIGWMQGASRPERLPGGGTLWNGVVVDITARKEAEAERDQFFALALEMMGIAGQDGYFHRLNPAFSQTLGWSEAELLARPCLDYVHPDDRAASTAAWQKLQSGKIITGFENRLSCKDGAYRWLEWKATWEDGVIYAAAHDITARKASEAALREGRDELEVRVAERTAELATANAELQVQIKEREEAEAETWARARQQEAVAELGRLALTGLDIDTLLSGATALTCATLDVEISAITEVLHGAGGALQIRAGSGWSRDVLGQVVPGGTSSKAGYVLISQAPVIVTDLAAETRFTPLPLLLDEGIKSGVTVMIGALDQPFGTLGAHSKKSRAFTQDDVNFLLAMSNVLAAALERRRIESEIRGLNGELESANLQLKVENAERQMALGALREATVVLKTAKDEAENATAAANAANLAKSEFLGRMSHELRTPLNAILGFGQILEMRAGDAAFGTASPEAKAAELRQLGNIEQILKAGRHLLSLINEVLDITRIEAGHLSLSPEPVAIGTITCESLDLVRPLAAQRRITLHNLVTGEPGRRHVLADLQRFKQVLLNLLSNAVKYGRDGGEVWVGCEVLAALPQEALAQGGGPLEIPIEDQGRLRFLVRDNGAGLSQSDIERLFVPFERLQAARSQIEGTGIGLTLCKRLIEAMGGQIGVCSEVGAGSTFWVELPIASSPLERDTGADLEAVVRTGGVRDLGTLLYIEDNLSNISLIEHALSVENLRVKFLAAMQGSVGLELAAQHHPDLILLDVHLPDIMGDAVLKQLKSQAATRDIPVIVLSADATASQVERLMQAGAAAYLTKPLDLKRFFSVLESVSSKSAQRLHKTNL